MNFDVLAVGMELQNTQEENTQHQLESNRKKRPSKVELINVKVVEKSQNQNLDQNLDQNLGQNLDQT